MSPPVPAAGALLDAIKAGDFARVEAMVSAEPSLVDASDGGQSAVLTAAYHRRQDVVDLLVSRGASLSIFEASAVGELDRVERLTGSDRGIVNGYSADGWTPLHLAAFFGHLAVAEHLIAQGADVTARSRNANGNTPLHAALAVNQTALAGLLIRHAADVNAGDAGGWRPLHLAAAGNNVEAIRMLAGRGAAATAVNGEGVTPLALARQMRHAEAEAALLSRDRD